MKQLLQSDFNRPRWMHFEFRVHELSDLAGTTLRELLRSLKNKIGQKLSKFRTVDALRQLLNGTLYKSGPA